MKTSLLVLALLLPLTLPAQEEVRYYDVEVILFENLDPAARASEHWPESVELEMDERTIEIGQPWPGPIPAEYDPARSFKPVPPAEYQLTEQARKIDESPTRRLLLHTAWRQPGMPQDTALKVHFRREIPAVAEPAPLTEAEPPLTDAQPGIPPEAGELEGLIQVILARYLHVKADIVFRPETPLPSQDESLPEGFQPLPANRFTDTGAETTAPAEGRPEDAEPIAPVTTPRAVVYHLNQMRRRMRSRELHYLDHPVLGMLIRITPVEEG